MVTSKEMAKYLPCSGTVVSFMPVSDENCFDPFGIEEKLNV